MRFPWSWDFWKFENSRMLCPLLTIFWVTDNQENHIGEKDLIDFCLSQNEMKPLPWFCAVSSTNNLLIINEVCLVLGKFPKCLLQWHLTSCYCGQIMFIYIQFAFSVKDALQRVEGSQLSVVLRLVISHIWSSDATLDAISSLDDTYHTRWVFNSFT